MPLPFMNETDVTHRLPLLLLSSQRPEHIVFNLLLREHPDLSPSSLDSILSSTPIPKEDHRLVRALLHKHLGAQLFARGELEAARAAYLRGVREILSPSVVVPVEDPREAYGKLEWKEFLDLAALGNNVALTYSRQGDMVQAMRWLEEVEMLFYCQTATQMPHAFEWKNWHMQSIEFFSLGMKVRARHSELFDRLHNTGAALTMTARAHHLGCKDEFVLPASLTPLADKSMHNWHRLLQFRHPDASLAHVVHDIVEPALQVRGAWVRLGMQRRLAARSDACVFVWRSRLYVFGGRNLGKFVWHKDFHYLDLKAEPRKKWHSLPFIPEPARWRDKTPFKQQLDSWNVVVWDDAAWIFLGSTQLAKFDLVGESWSIVDTTAPAPGWPYAGNCEAFSMAVHKGIIYVFGGGDSDRRYGTDLFMALDLETLRWRHISGSAKPFPRRSSPGLRTHASCWVEPSSEKLYILYGTARRTAATKVPEVYSEEDFNYGDMWSFHIPSSTWRLERLHGNVPCPRTESPASYNAVLDKVFLFGGYNPSCSSMVRPGILFHYAYFADTFMWTPSASSWSQVMTLGFPTARAQASLVTDLDTGRMYLFGGYCNSQFVGRDKAVMKVFSDVWQLCVDLPGGELDKVNLEEEARLAALGADQRCFNCSAIGRFSRCGGTCKGAVALCSRECMAESWPEHRQMHGCQKKSP